MTKVPRVRKFIAHEPGFTIVDAMDKLFQHWFDGPSWDVWRIVLKAACCLPTSSTIAFGACWRASSCTSRQEPWVAHPNSLHSKCD
jgi:hypothetical protein